MIELLPPPPLGKTGWPWTDESFVLAPFQATGKPWPKISIITPSFNQGRFIEETIRSIILQNYPNLEYLIIDGGSTDNTLEIIKKYEPWISYLKSEKDSGQSNAINKGFIRCSGEYVNWICSDDLLCRNAINKFAENYFTGSNNLFIGTCLLIDKEGKQIGTTKSQITNFEELIDIAKFWRKNDSIAQQSTFYPTSIIKKMGGLEDNNHFTMDFQLWGELLLNGVTIKNIPLQIGIFRWYGGQKTSFSHKVTTSLIDTCIKLIKKNQKYTFVKKQCAILKILRYYFTFQYHQFRTILGIRRRLLKLTGNGL